MCRSGLKRNFNWVQSYESLSSQCRKYLDFTIITDIPQTLRQLWPYVWALYLFFSNRDLCKKTISVNSEDADNMNYNAMIDNVGFLFNKVLKVM